MSNRRPAPSRKGAPAAALLGPSTPTTKIIEGESVATPEAPSPVSGPPVERTPMAQATVSEHEDKQRAYREWVAKMSAETKVDRPEVVEEAPDAAALAALEQAKAAEALIAAQSAWLAEYAEAAAQDRDRGTPVYVVGLRPPRPRWHGVQLQIGDVVPGAHHYPRIESWVRTGILVPKILSEV